MLAHTHQQTAKDARLFRVAYTSRAHGDMDARAAEAMAARDALRNRRRAVSGALIYREGRFLQWLEGPAAQVCEVMATVQKDPRHADVTVLSAGWIGTRRFPLWSMRLANRPVANGAPAQAADAIPRGIPDAASAAREFDQAAIVYRSETLDEPCWTELAQSLLHPLAKGTEERLPDLPEQVQGAPEARAAFVDECCRLLGKGWAESRLSGFEVTLATSRLNRLILRGGRPAEPEAPRGSVLVLAPHGCSEIAGAIAKADLLRSAGYSVRMVPWASTPTLKSLLKRTGSCSILVYGGRVGVDSKDARRGRAMVERLRSDFPGRTILLGGRRSGPLCEWPERLAFLSDARRPFIAKDVDWLAVSSLASAARAAWAG